MASVYPGAFDAFSNPLPTDKRTNHAAQHGNVNDAVEAIQSVLGLSPAGGSATVSARIGVVEGGVLSRVSGPGSSTDNALVRFDGTDGKTVQTSGITVDDSGNVTSDLVVSKANPAVQMHATSGAADFYLDTTAGNAASIRFRTGTSLRWIVSKDSSAESSTATGSDLYVSGYNNSGSLIGSYLQVQRSTGRFTIYNTGAGAGLRLGSGGPEVMSGTGSPESVVTAPVGSTWTDTAATTGAIQWIKATGTGNTGWVVQYGDTGRRNIKASLENSWSTYGGTDPVYVRRIGSHVQIESSGIVGTSASSTTFYTLPVGFRPTGTFNNFFANYTGAGPASNGLTITSGGLCILGGTSANYTSGRFFASWMTSDAWPASLPGSAA